MTELRIGYVPLTDAAVLIAAAERGFAARRGLALTLEREASWATLRDKLVLGVVDAAHMLAPLAVATSIGLPPFPALPLVVPFALNLNGNAITVSAELWAEIAAAGETGTPSAVATSLGRVVRRRAARGAAELTFATVFPFSTHTYQLRLFLRLGGIDPDREVRLTVVPPPYTVDALRTGAVDGFCVGSPWNSVAVAAGIGRIAALGSALVPDAPEKVLAWPRGRIAPGTAAALLAALGDAAAWCAAPANHAALAALLGGSRFLATDPELIRRTFTGRLLADRDGAILCDPAYLRIGGAVHVPDPAHAAWIYERMVECGQAPDEPDLRARAMEVYARQDEFAPAGHA